MKRVVFSHFNKIFYSSITVFLILTCCSFILSAPINNNVSYFNDTNGEDSLKAANFPLDISPIIIDDNWTETEATYDWCSGSGTFGDPFLIANIILDCKQKSSGLEINNSDKNYFVIQNCTFYNCSSFAAIIIQNSNNGLVNECNLSYNNQIGIQLDKTDNCSFTCNTISDNEIGISLEKTTECVFYKNNITYNNVIGVSISTPNSDLNLFYWNNFSNNVLNAVDATDNEWDNGSIGNYWDDYAGHDLDDDGIGDDPYVIDSDSQDNFPIWNDGDDINPVLTVLAPSNNTVWSTPPLVNVSAFDINLDTIWYIVNDSEQITELQNETAEYLLNSLWNDLGEGKFNISFYANDTAGNENNGLVIDLYKDTKNPFINIISPGNHTFWNHRPTIEVSVSDTHFQSVWYEINGQKEMLSNGVGEILNNSMWESIPDDSSFTINFYANDSAGNINNSYSLDLYKDTINPTLSISLPTNDTYWNIRPNVQATASDTNFDSIWYEVDGFKIILDNGVAQLLDQGIWDNLLDEQIFIIYFFANDSAGNVNALYSRTIHKDILNPILTVNLPLEGSYWNLPPDIQVTASDMNLDSLWYEVGGVKILLDNGISEPFDQGIWDSLSAEETFIINFYGNDSAGNVNSLYTRTIHKDITEPSLSVDFPLNDSYWNTRPDIQATASDANFDSIWYEIGGVKILLENGVSELLDQDIWDSLLAEETFTINFFANDSAGNVNALYSRMLHKDILEPSLTIDFPLEGSFWNNRPDIQTTAIDTNLDSLWYEVGGVKVFLDNGISESFDQGIWDSLLDEETFTIYFFANDSAGNVNSLYSRTIHKDVTDPLLTVNLPLDDSYWNTRPNIQTTASDINLDSIWYVVDGSKILLENGVSEILDIGIWDGLSNEDTFTIFFYANDSAGNVNSLYSRTIHKDVTDPLLTVNLPLDDSYWNTRPNIQTTASDINLDSIWYEVGGLKVFLDNGVSESFDQGIWDSLLDEETFTINFFANDSAGNVNSLYSRIIHKDTIGPILIIDLPLDGTYWNARPYIQATASDINFESIWYEISGVKISLENGVSELLDQDIWDALLAEETFTINFFANDSAGNTNSLHSAIIYKDVLDPDLIVNLPLDDSYWNTRPDIQVTASDTNLDSLWYEVSGTKIMLENGVSELLDQGIWDALLNEESFIIYFYANDSAGNINSLRSRAIHKDISDPIMTIDSPLDATYWNARPYIQVTASDINLDSIWYEISGIKISLENGVSELLDQDIWDALLAEETFTINFFANDSAGNTNSLHSITIHKDVLDPSLIIDLPLDGTYWNTRPYIQATASDTNLESVWYVVDGTKILLENGVSELLDQDIWDTLLAEETFIIYFYVNDSAGNLNSLTTITIHKDILNPDLTINLPLDNSYWNTRPDIQATGTDTNLDSIWYEVDGVKILLNNGMSELLNQGIWNTLLAEETFTIYFYANDSAGNVNSLYSRTIHKDIIDPTLVVNLPLDDSYWNTIPNIQATASDTNLDSIWYEIGGVKVTLSNGVIDTLDQDIWDSLTAEETFKIYFFANDSAGNINSLYSRTIHKDILNPDLFINLPSDGSYWNTRPNIQATASDTNLDSIWYEVSGTKIILENGLMGLFDQVIWDSFLAEETFIIYFYANDSAGNVNSLNTITIHKDILDPDVNVNLPFDNTYWNIRPDIQVTATDINFDSLWYEVDGSKILLENGISELFDQDIWDSLLAEETFTIYFFANDSAGNINSLNTRTIHKDVLDPQLTINLPLDGTFWNIVPNIQASASDINFDSVWYEVDGTKVILENGISQSLDQVIWDALSSEETFTIFFYANDSAGNVNSLNSRTIHKDITDPSLIINFPLNDTYWNTRPNVQITASDINFDSVWYEVDSSKIFLENGISELLDQGIWDALLNEETFTIYFFANDSAGNVNSLFSRTIHKDIDDPSLTVNLPFDGTYWNARPSIQATVIDINLDSIWYLVDESKMTLSNGLAELLDQDIWDSIAAEETFTIYFFANDSAGNVNSLYSRTIYKDVTDPVLTVNLPLEDTYWNTRPNIQVTVSDINIDSVWYEVDGTYIMLESGISELLDQGIWDALFDEETFTIHFYANDSAGNVNSLYSRTIHKDITAPSMSVNLPLDGSYWNSLPTIQSTATDINFDSIWYEVDGTYIMLESGISELLDQGIWDALFDEETFTIHFYANDSAGNVNSLYSRTIHKDITAPSMSVNLPLDGSYWNTLPTIQATVSDTNFDAVWYEVGGIRILLENGVEETLDQDIWDALLAEETFTIYFYANDSAGNINSLYSRTIHKDITDPALTIDLPLDDSYWNTRPNVQILASDINLDSVWYVVDGIKIMLESGISELLDQSIWEALSEEETFTIYFYANDSAGNVNSLYSRILHKDIKGPDITITNPSNYDVFGLTAPSCMVNFYDLNGVDERWYQLSNGTLTTPIRNWIGSINTDDWTLMQNGTVSILFYSNDSLGNIEMQSIFVYKDVISPIITINSPQPFDLFGTIAPSIDLDVYDPHLETIWYQLENASMYKTGLFLWTGSISSANWNLMGNGTVQIHFLAYDSVNNIAYKDLIIRKNIYDPIITILSPIDGTIVGRDPPIMNLYYVSAEIDSVWYYLSNGSVITSNTTWTGSIDLGLWNLFDDGNVDIHFYINDTLGNIGSDSKSFIKDITVPTISVYAPNNYDIFGKNPPVISIDFYDLHDIDQKWYQLSHSTFTTSLRNWEGSISIDDWDLMPNGTVTITFYVNDSVGNLASQNITIYKDSIEPSLTVNLPFENTYWNSRPTIQALASDQNFDSVWYEFGGIKIILENGVEETLDQDIWDALFAEETFTIYFYANDTVGNVNALHSRTLHKDIIAPKLTIDFPEQYTFWNSPPNIQVTAFDINFDSIWYNVYGTNIMLENGIPQSLDQEIWDDLDLESSFWIHFYANDSAGNVNYSVSFLIFKDTKSPEISISNPTGYELFGKDEPVCAVSFYDTNGVDERWYQLTNGETTTSLRLWTGSIDASDWDLMPNGTVTIVFYANDSVGNLASQNITVYKDSIDPSLTINLPLENTYWNTLPTIQAIASDQNFDSVWYVVDGTKITLQNGVSELLDQNIWDAISGEAPFTIYFFANDTVGNINNLHSMVLYKDTIAPKITIDLPTTNSIWNTPPNLQITISDFKFDSVWYVVDGTKITLQNGVAELLDQGIWDKLSSETSFMIHLYANDSAGNINSSVSIILFKDTNSPEVTINSPSEFDLFGKEKPSCSVDFYDVNGIDSRWYQLTNGFTTSTMRPWTGSINNVDWDLFGNGTVTIIFHAYDEAGNVGTLNVTVYKDIKGPQVTIYYPDEGQLYGLQVPTIYNYLIEPNGISTTTYQLSNGTFSTPRYEWTGIISQTVWDQIRNGTVIITIYAIDTLGNEGSDFITIRKDTIAPSIDINAPQNNQEVGRESPFFEVDISDGNFASSWYRIIGTNRSIFFSGVYGKIVESLWEEIWDSIEENDTIIIRFYANDSLGNENYKDLILLKPITSSGTDDHKLPNFPIKPIELIPLTVIIGFTVALTAIIKKSRFYNVTDKKHQKLVNRILVLVALLSTLITISILIQ